MRPEIVVLDRWEILPQRIQFLEKLGEGAFGEVHSAVLEKLTFDKGSIARRYRRKSKKAKIVAVKIMHGG